MTGTRLSRLADLAEALGSQHIRFTPTRRSSSSMCPRRPPANSRSTCRNSTSRSSRASGAATVLACTGLEFCKLALTDTKKRARWTVEELEKRLPDMDVPFSIHLNGCPNACARSQVADVGLKGMLDQREDGSHHEVFQVLLGGALAEDTSLARKARALKVTGDDLPDYIERLTRTYLDQREVGESLAHWARHAADEDIR